MSNHTFRAYNFVQQNPLSPFEQEPAVVINNLMTSSHMDSRQDTVDHSFATTETIDVNVDRHSTAGTTASILPWRPNTRLRKLHTKFQNIVLYQHICTPCVYCARLLYPKKAKWIPYNDNVTYPLQIHFPELNIIHSGNATHPKVSVCPGCKIKPKQHLCPRLHHIPSEIEQIPLMQRRFLSPVFLHCSLGRSANGNPYSEYRKLIGDMRFSRNMRALKLYSGIVGAFLSTNEEETWLTPNLLAAARWLSQHNCYIKPLAQYLSSLSANSQPFPTAHHNPDDVRAPPFQERDLVVPNGDFSTEIHDEDFHYTHLMAGFVKNSNGTTLPLSFNDPELEPLLFPDLFPDGKGHYYELTNLPTDNGNKVETYGKYIKHRLLCVDPRFRLHPYWPSWSYMQLEKLRNHQNTNRLWRQKQNDNVYKPPTAAELITQSIYNGKKKIDETKTITLPSFIRTGDSYFHEKLLHVNAMTNEFGLPTLFVTLTMAESKWTHLKEILEATDNGDPLPTNRPLHSTLYFVHLKQEIKHSIWSKQENCRWGELNHFFERVEFQNRGAAHIHTCLWVSAQINEMITCNVIRADLPDPELEPELYSYVKQHQIHTCSYGKCGGPALPGQRCKKNFPRPFSLETYYKQDELRYVYRCVKPEDQWVVPYHPETLMFWNAHINVQYVTSRGLGKYLTKYVAKTEPSHVFNISDGDHYREHIIARRLSSMECMFLLLGETICNSSVQVKYLPTDSPSTRVKAIKPIFAIHAEDEDPYWKDCIEKYFARPNHHIFENITYPEYFKNYNLLTKYPISASRSTNTEGVYQDELNYFIVKRTKPLIVRFHYLKIQDGEPFFYQQLLLNLPCRSEEEILGGYQTYREHYLSLHPNFSDTLHMQLLTSAQTHRHTMQMQFDQAIIYLQEFLKNDILISPNMQNILQIQLNALKQLPPILPHTAMLDLPDEQYRVLNTIITSLGSTSSKKWPYFFITGSAGTGKSYLIKMILNWLNQRKNKYLLLAPTGVAAQNIGGFTIHSALRITQSESGFQTLAYHDPEFRNGLLKMETIIIDEISMVPASLFTFMANMFGRIHGNDMAFGGINVIAVGDLAQLPPVRASPVFHSSVWHLFYPLFLRQPKRQHQDESFYRMLEEIRLGNISQNTWNKLLQKAAIYQTDMSLDNILTITHVVGHRRTADMINRVICNVLPIENECFLISEAIDFQNGVQASSKTLQAEFKTKTNLPLIVRLQQGARVMFLNNSLISEGICNGTIGIVVCVDKSIPKVQIAFCVRETIVLKWVTQQTSYFYAFGQHASRTQFPLQNSFALTIHKTQGITLQHVSLALDSQIFSPGQTYVAISRCPTWDKVCISSIHRDAFITDPEVINEYERLERIASQKLPIV